MALLKQGTVVDDSYTDVSRAEALPESGPLLVSLQQWDEHRESLLNRNEPLGIVLRSDEKPTAIAEDIEHFDMIALDFPAFADGRAYSSARLLRDRYNYQGEIRAIGDVLLEQLHFMNRVGFNAYLIESDNAVQDWEIASADISVWYQPTNDGRTDVLSLRHRQD
jgi:uncharacterized protein (DUF934 family)